MGIFSNDGFPASGKEITEEDIKKSSLMAEQMGKAAADKHVRLFFDLYKNITKDDLIINDNEIIV